MFSEVLAVMAEILVLFVVAAAFFLVVVPVILWTYDKIKSARRRRRMYRVAILQVHRYIRSLNGTGDLRWTSAD